MPAETAAAMWQESNTTMAQQEIILHYLSNEFGTQLDVPRCKIRQFGNKHVSPDCAFYETADKKKIHYWTKPIEKVLMKCI